jgi:hypothetical protein
VPSPSWSVGGGDEIGTGDGRLMPSDVSVGGGVAAGAGGASCGDSNIVGNIDRLLFLRSSRLEPPLLERFSRACTFGDSVGFGAAPAGAPFEPVAAACCGDC